jgi:hypothetical protein
VGKKEGGLKLDDVGVWVRGKGKGVGGGGGGGGFLLKILKKKKVWGGCVWHQVNKPKGREARLVVSFIQMKPKMIFSNECNSGCWITRA